MKVRVLTGVTLVTLDCSVFDIGPGVVP